MPRAPDLVSALPAKSMAKFSQETASPTNTKSTCRYRLGRWQLRVKARHKAAGKPSKVDDGVIDPKITKEWIEQILNSKVQPRMDGVRIERIDMETGKFGYVITAQQSQIGPHQAPDGKYYKRFNFQSVPMHDYEIRDIMRRSTTPNLDVTLSLPQGNKYRLEFPAHQEILKPVLMGVTISNKSPTPAYHTIVEVFVDDILQVPFSTQFNQVGVAEDPARQEIQDLPLDPIVTARSTNFRSGQPREPFRTDTVAIPLFSAAQFDNLLGDRRTRARGSEAREVGISFRWWDLDPARSE
jgi:hypothetical protein